VGNDSLLAGLRRCRISLTMRVSAPIKITLSQLMARSKIATETAAFFDNVSPNTPIMPDSTIPIPPGVIGTNVKTPLVTMAKIAVGILTENPRA